MLGRGWGCALRCWLGYNRSGIKFVGGEGKGLRSLAEGGEI